MATDDAATRAPLDRRGARRAARRVPRHHHLEDPLPREPGADRPRAHAVGIPEVLRPATSPGCAGSSTSRRSTSCRSRSSRSVSTSCPTRRRGPSRQPPTPTAPTADAPRPERPRPCRRRAAEGARRRRPLDGRAAVRRQVPRQSTPKSDPRPGRRPVRADVARSTTATTRRLGPTDGEQHATRAPSSRRTAGLDDGAGRAARELRPARPGARGRRRGLVRRRRARGRRIAAGFFAARHRSSPPPHVPHVRRARSRAVRPGALPYVRQRNPEARARLRRSSVELAGARSPTAHRAAARRGARVARRVSRSSTARRRDTPRRVRHRRVRGATRRARSAPTIPTASCWWAC